LQLRCLVNDRRLCRAGNKWACRADPFNSDRNPKDAAPAVAVADTVFLRARILGGLGSAERLIIGRGLKEERERYVANLTLGVDRNVNPSIIGRNVPSGRAAAGRDA